MELQVYQVGFKVKSDSSPSLVNPVITSTKPVNNKVLQNKCFLTYCWAVSKLQAGCFQCCSLIDKIQVVVMAAWCVAGLFSDHESSMVPESDQSPAEPLPSELQTLRRQRHPVSGEKMFLFPISFQMNPGGANVAWSERTLTKVMCC